MSIWIIIIIFRSINHCLVNSNYLYSSANLCLKNTPASFDIPFSFNYWQCLLILFTISWYYFVLLGLNEKYFSTYFKQQYKNTTYTPIYLAKFKSNSICWDYDDSEGLFGKYSLENIFWFNCLLFWTVSFIYFVSLINSYRRKYPLFNYFWLIILSVKLNISLTS